MYSRVQRKSPQSVKIIGEETAGAPEGAPESCDVTPREEQLEKTGHHIALLTHPFLFC